MTMPNRILAIDPGPKKSAFVVIEPGPVPRLSDFGIVDSQEMILEIDAFTEISWNNQVVVEMVACYGMPVGRSVFDTALMIGRYLNEGQSKVRLMIRKKVTTEICNSAKATDANIRQAMIDLYGPTKEQAIGGVKCRKCKGKGWFGAGRAVCPSCNGGKWLHPPGPLVDVHDDIWAALALAVAASRLWHNPEAFYTETINID